MKIPTLLLTIIVLFSGANYCRAQEIIDAASTEVAPTLSTGERLRQIEEILQLIQSRKLLREIDALRKAERELKGILETDPSSVFKSQVEANLDVVNERLAYHDLLVASFYMNKGHGLRGARSRLESIIRSYPKFSKMDEVLFRLNVISVAEEKEAEAARHSWTLICNYPNSEYVHAAFEQLNKIGVSSWEGCEQYKR